MLAVAPDLVDGRAARRRRARPCGGAAGCGRRVAVVLGAPPGPSSVGGEHGRVRVPGPQERAAGGGLVGAGQLQRVVAEGGPEVGPPLGLPVVAVGPGVGEHVDAVVADLHRQRVGVPVRGDRQEPVRAAVAAAPDLAARRRSMRRIVMPGVGEGAPGAAAGRGAVTPKPRPAQGGQQRGADVGAVRPAGHQARRPNSASPVASSEPHRWVPAPSTTSPKPSSASPWRGGCSVGVHDRGERVGHPQQHQPGRLRHRDARGVRLERAGEAQLQHEAVVLGGELPVEPGAERVGLQVLVERVQRLGPPADRLREPAGTPTRPRAAPRSRR